MELSGYFVFWLLDNILFLAKLGLFRKNPLVFSRPSIMAWFFALIMGLLYHGRKILRLWREKARAVRSVRLGGPEGTGDPLATPIEQLEEIRRQVKISFFHILKNCFDLLPSSEESGGLTRA